MTKYQGYTEEKAREELINIITNAILETHNEEAESEEAYASEVKVARTTATDFVKYYFNFDEVETEEETETSISDELI